jgi:hypothetical protein
MKKFISTLLISSFIFISSTVLADAPGPPSPPGNPNTTGGVPVGASIDSGVIFLLLLGAIYGASKLYQVRKAKHVTDIEKEVSTY